ncbi:hypothetical protein BCU68_08620 [Vibrio sp. 10N.286.49.B3]|nr:hypothetical protein BCU68_08620 [Vibrio sp. 10N.286.49.B3]
MSALIVDDSPIILSNIRRMLLTTGFSDKNIFHAKDPKAAIWHCRKIKFDVVVCDYNFCTRLNGKQVFEELRHYQLINPQSVFVMITGESSCKIVRSIIELSPDEYLLKPFNTQFFTQKVNRALKRKKALYQLYQAKKNKNYQQGLEVCDELMLKYPQYHGLIQKFQGEFYSLLNMFNAAKDLYDSIIAVKDVEWANAGLADSLIELGELSRAESIVSKMLDKAPNSLIGLSLNAKYDIFNDNVPSAIKHFTLLSELAPGNPERELVIANLCLSQADFRNAASRFMVYYELNIDTYRDSLESRYNYIRCILFIYDSIDSYNAHSNDDSIFESPEKLKQEALNEFRNLSLLNQKKLVVGEGALGIEAQLNDYSIDKELLACHFSIIGGRLSEAVTILKHLYCNNLVEGFYNNYHYNYLLSLLSFNKEFNDSVSTSKDLMKNEDKEISPMLLKSQLEMVNALNSTHQNKINIINNKYDDIQVAVNNSDATKVLDVLLEIKEINNYIRENNMTILKYLTISWPTDYHRRNVRDLAQDSYHICKELYSPKEMQEYHIESNYQITEKKSAPHIA